MKNKIAFLVKKKKFYFPYENIDFLSDDFLIVKITTAAIISYEQCINFQNKYLLPLNNLITHTLNLGNIQNAFELNKKYKKNIFRAAIVN